MKRNEKIFFVFFAIIFLFIFLTGFSFAEAAAENNPANRANAVIAEVTIPQLPSSLNGVQFADIPGSRDLITELESLYRSRGAVRGLILLYENLDRKYKKILEYSKNYHDETALDKVFPGGFTTAASLKESAAFPADLNEEERAGAISAIEDKLTVLDIKKYEKELINSGKINPVKAKIYYDNASFKSGNFLNSATDEFLKKKERLEADIVKFRRRAIDLKFRIGSTESASGTKKHFDEKDPIFIGIISSTEGIDGLIPAEWKLTGPGRQSQSGIFSLTGGSVGELKEIYRDATTVKKVPGKYKIEVVLFPNEEEKIKYSESFLLGTVPFQIEQAFVLDGQKKTKSTFKPGEEIILAVLYKPFSASVKTAQFIWTVYSPDGAKYEPLSKIASLKLRPNNNDVQTKYIKAPIPKDAPGGTYKFQATIINGSFKETSDVVNFTVNKGFSVKISTSRSIVVPGEKVVFTPIVSGGVPPYSFFWEFDTGETSSSQSVAFVFSQAGDRTVTLTVTDSSTPTPLSRSDKVKITVNE